MEALGSVRVLRLSWTLALLAGSSAVATGYVLVSESTPTRVQAPSTPAREAPELRPPARLDELLGNPDSQLWSALPRPDLARAS